MSLAFSILTETIRKLFRCEFMFGNLWNRLLVTPAFLSLALVAAVPAHAASEAASSKASNLKSADLQSAGAAESSLPQAALTATLPALETTQSPSAATAVLPSQILPESASAPTAAQSLANQSLTQQPTEATSSLPVGFQAGLTPSAQPAAVMPIQPVQQVAQAKPASTTNSVASTDANSSTLDQINKYSGNGGANANPMSQVTSITQFSDVKPTDWAYQALQSLVERYGCIVGYPDRTYRGQRALTRFEFAAGLNACLDRISELIASSTADLATKEDLATLQRLQEEFAAELAALRGRVDALDARVSELEANQFSTTTKLSGETIFSIANAFGGPQASNNTTFGYRTRLVFDSSFTGNDRLRARLQVGNILPFNRTNREGATVLGNEGRLGYDTNTSGNLQLDILSYLFKIGPVSIMAIGQVPDFQEVDTIVNVVSPFASSGRGAISRFGRFNPIFRLGSGAGGAAAFNLGKFATISGAYLGGNSSGAAGDPSPGRGLFNGNYAALGQISLTPIKDLTLSFTYINSYANTSISSTTGLPGALGFNTGTGTSAAQVRVGAQPVSINSYGVAANFRLAKVIQIGGWGGYSAVRVIGTGDAQVWNYAGTIGIADLGKKGSLLGFVVGVEPYLGGTSGFTVSGRRRDANPLHVEAFYRFQLTDNISITPGFIYINNPNGTSSNSDVYIGALRSTFSF